MISTDAGEGTHSTGWREALLQRHRQAATSAVRSLPPGTFDSALLIGSLAAGLGTTSSDVDLLLLTDGPLLERPSPKTGASGVGRIDVEHLTLAEATARIESLRTYRVTESVTTQVYEVAEALELYCGLSSTPIVLQESDQLRALLDLCRTVDRSAARIRVTRATLLANNTLEDTLGFVATGDADSALISAATLLHFAVDAFCTANGDLYFGQKWNVQRLRRVLRADDPSGRAVVEALTGGAADRDAAFRLVARRIATAQQLLATANLTVWLDNEVRLMVPPAGPPSRGSVRRADRWHLLKYVERWILSDGRRHYEVPWTAVLVWSLAGTGAASLEAAARSEIERQLGRAVSEALPRSLLQRLLELGALTTGDSVMAEV
ncbi:hypothetical protein ACFCV3_00475 [Kribbella sp. NPDC056345]|uniref:hypothetical protein n=1 Tax=Kribbella sp. NPDC056345 TaxID=3345789 RepID=UPI0035DCEC11